MFLIHGESDIDVTIDHGKLLASKCRNPYNPWWVEDGDHNNIDYNFRKNYYLKIGKFLKFVRNFNLDKPMDELEEFYTVNPWWNRLDHIYFRRIAKVEERYKKITEKKKTKLTKNIKILTNSVCLTSSPSLDSNIFESSENSMTERQFRKPSGTKEDSFRGKKIKSFLLMFLRARSTSLCS